MPTVITQQYWIKSSLGSMALDAELYTLRPTVGRWLWTCSCQVARKLLRWNTMSPSCSSLLRRRLWQAGQHCINCSKLKLILVVNSVRLLLLPLLPHRRRIPCERSAGQGSRSDRVRRRRRPLRRRPRLGHWYAEEDGTPKAPPVALSMSTPIIGSCARCPARRAGSAPQGRSPVRARPGAAERSGAALIQYGLIRQRSGTRQAD